MDDKIAKMACNIVALATNNQESRDDRIEYLADKLTVFLDDLSRKSPGDWILDSYNQEYSLKLFLELKKRV